ncbi:UDP-N-acetylmuramoyl-L-alanine--D-glutamate ligase [Nocardia donostiensis]|uniref:UDP-N-acetylmuramoylalanine--D-glutamate ligase n=1 Tax=Nocardia donostiensis TaxID=1538463 RepID=A0A1W0AQE6_9NOCA|nr:UDP-N-acetylmuramoyl-L-alanine--D-glutamate ligase [Nocardia donostiensis]ONM46148.1 UDP-N-acetylmuramoyl-L-alanine--D-glutamate ligase [Nocardia donostiensis]OQS12467.1 UDP-N-acetylmuramoyl-L-alanine--D-glutamate ligase [Nocardia donostiensis]OQS18510.1 UDP-N-acetylmuramoyl-L-alanine--D-glutamate ligase [Nocardia donostiensis]
MLEFLRGRDVLVAGWGVSGRSLVEPLFDIGARPVVTDSGATALAEAAELGLDVATSAELEASQSATWSRFALVITSPGWRPDSPVLASAVAEGIPVWGDVEFAWWVDQARIYGPVRKWLVVTGTNGKTTTTSMVYSILRAAGIASVACGNIGLPILDALRRNPGPQVLAVELSSFQLHWAPSVRPEAGVVLNVAEDHLDWHGGLDAYAAAKARALLGRVGVVGLDDPVAASLARRSKARRTVGFRVGVPADGELGVVDGKLLDRAFTKAAILAEAGEISPPGPAGIADALAAAALTRAIDVAPQFVREGLVEHKVGPHRAALVRELGGVVFVDDSKATNPHAARSSILAHQHVVWIAGGQLKGASVEELIEEVADRLIGAVLIGVDAPRIAAMLARHAPQVPVVEVSTGDHAGMGGHTNGSGNADAVMTRAVRAAAEFAGPGDTVLLAPAAASLDMFADYAHRGRSFATAVQALEDEDLGRRL